MIDNRIIRMLLVVALSLIMIPGVAFASDPGETPEDNFDGGNKPETECVDTSSRDIIKKQDNPLMLGISAKTYMRSKLKKKKSFTLTVSDAGGQVTYNLNKKAKKAKIKVKQVSYNTVGSGSDATVTAQYKIIVPKKCKKGTYKITINASGNDIYNSGKKTLKIKVK